MPNKADKRQIIMQAAETLFTSRRFHEITLDEVAQAAGVGKGTIYRYCQDKDDLFFQTASAGLDALCELIRTGVPAGASFEEKILAVCEQISSFYRRRRELSRMMQDHEGRMPWCAGEEGRRWSQRRENLVSAVADVFREGIRTGRIRPDLSPEALAAFLLGMLRARAREFASRPAHMPALSTVVDLLIRGAGETGGRAMTKRSSKESAA